MRKNNAKYRLQMLLLMGLTTIISLGTSVGTTVAADTESGFYEQEFVVSAYYSPLPGQQAYVTGSYAGDIRLNGGGRVTASGTLVAETQGCFLASPPEYTFGTIMELDGIGKCVVLDRGGAFKNGLLRLDLWLGYGDEGRTAAMQWGLRRVSVKVYSDTGAPNLANSYGGNYAYLPGYQKNVPQNPFEFVRELTVGDSGEDVARLQQLLKDLQYFKGEVDGVFDSDTEMAVKGFQDDKGFLDSPDFEQAGKFGGFTMDQFGKEVARFRDEYYEFVPNRNLGRGARGEDVRRLQDLLYRLGYLEAVSGLYDAATVGAVAQFQLDQGVITDDSDQGAGYFGPATQYALDRVFYLIENDKLDKSANDSKNHDNSFPYVETDDLITYGLGEGDSGEEVVKLQQALRAINYLRIEPTGYYGPLTQHAVFKFQQRVGLVAEPTDDGAGYVGPQTRTAINSFLNSRNMISSNLTSQTKVQESDEVFSRNLVPGDRGSDVKELQRFLKEKGYFTGPLTTEYFGEVTQRSLSEFQEDNNLEVTGELDEATLTLVRSLR